MSNARQLLSDYYSNKIKYQSVDGSSMHFPQTVDFNFRQLKATDIHQLSESQAGQHRRYVQLQPAELRADLTELKLAGVILFREQLNASVQIEAGPPDNFVPFGVLLSNLNDIQFCNREIPKSSLLQGSGGEWSLYCRKPMDLLACIIDKSVLTIFTELLTGKDVPSHWFMSQAKKIAPQLLLNFMTKMQWLIKQVEHQPELLNSQRIKQQLSSDFICQVITLLSSSQEHKLSSLGKRQRGVRRVIEYLTAHARELPSIPELCAVAQLGQRSLEYGFREQFNVTPVQYLKLVRLNGARRDLYFSDPHTTTVSDIALYWGFVELGRFSGVYGKLFNELPSKTLQQGPA